MLNCGRRIIFSFTFVARRSLWKMLQKKGRYGKWTEVEVQGPRSGFSKEEGGEVLSQ